MRLIGILFTVIALLLMTGQGGLTQTILPLWPEGEVPNFQKTDEREYRDSGDVIAVKLVQTPTVTVFLPSKMTATQQAVIICPGGGYGQLSYDLEGTDVAAWLVSHGIAAVVLKSRLPVAKSNVIRHLSPLMDAKRAIRVVRAHSEKWHIDPDQIGIMGFSAGGHLASTLATHFDSGDATHADPIERLSSRPDFAVLVYPDIIMTGPSTVIGTRNALMGEDPDTSLARSFSNELQVTDQTPPTFLVHAQDDPIVSVQHSLSFFQALKRHHVPAALHIFPQGGHGFGLGLNKGGISAWPDLCIQWLKGLQQP